MINGIISKKKKKNCYSFIFNETTNLLNLFKLLHYNQFLSSCQLRREVRKIKLENRRKITHLTSTFLSS